MVEILREEGRVRDVDVDRDVEGGSCDGGAGGLSFEVDGLTGVFSVAVCPPAVDPTDSYESLYELLKSDFIVPLLRAPLSTPTPPSLPLPLESLQLSPSPPPPAKSCNRDNPIPTSPSDSANDIRLLLLGSSSSSYWL